MRSVPSLFEVVRGSGVVRALGRWLLRSVYSRQRQLITIKRLDRRRAGPPLIHGVECVIVDSPDALSPLAHEIPAGFRDSAEELERRVSAGCVLCLARAKRDDGTGMTVIGYELAERGVFSALGRRVPVAHDVVFSHWAEVLPAYRGRRVHGLLFAVRDAYFRDQGATVVCGVCTPQNRASLHALRRDGAEVVGAVERVTLLRSFAAWQTPVERIEAAIAQV
ncbi:MAG TPA: hypothetical protein VEA38_05270 [Terriglobales bacterium]|nr:hypothetical protein [Terriglobales bacterium]